MEVVIKTIPHKDQRYDTCGDWWWEDTRGSPRFATFDQIPNSELVLQMRVSACGDWRKEMCVAYHELLEALECKARGITQKSVDDFDTTWEEHDGIDEPGDDPAAPYYWQHQHAMVAEQHLANCLELPWHEYEKVIFGLSQDG